MTHHLRTLGILICGISVYAARAMHTQTTQIQKLDLTPVRQHISMWHQLPPEKKRAQCYNEMLNMRHRAAQNAPASSVKIDSYIVDVAKKEAYKYADFCIHLFENYKMQFPFEVHKYKEFLHERMAYILDISRQLSQNPTISPAWQREYVCAHILFHYMHSRLVSHGI